MPVEFVRLSAQRTEMQVQRALNSIDIAETGVQNFQLVMDVVMRTPLSPTTAWKVLQLVLGILEQPKSKVEQWVKCIGELMPRMLAPDGPLLMRHNPTWIPEVRDDLFKLAIAAARQRCGSVRGFIPLIELLFEAGITPQQLIGFLRESHPPSFTSDPLSAFSWFELPLAPTCGELCGLGESVDFASKKRFIQAPMFYQESIEQLPKVSTHKPYASVEEYLSTYFTLFRADCFLEFTENVEKLLTKEDGFDPRDMAVFGEVSLGADLIVDDSRDLIYTLRCRPRSPRCVKASNLMLGNLLALSLDGTFSHPIWMTLADGPSRKVRQDFRGLHKTSVSPFIELQVRFCTEANGGFDTEIDAIANLSRSAPQAILVENPVFFTSYAPVLAALRDARGQNLPFYKQLVLCEQHSDEPSDSGWFQNLLKAEPKIFESLDPGQLKSYLHFAKNNFAIIQGPPGTGKSYIGVRIVYALVKAGYKVLVMSYKNHSLDEFIIDIRKLVPDAGRIVRLGHSPKMDSAVADCTMESLNDRARANKLLPGNLRWMMYEARNRHTEAVGTARRLIESLNGPIEINMDQFLNVTGEKGIAALELLAGKWHDKD
jgi:hypothetical protein